MDIVHRCVCVCLCVCVFVCVCVHLCMRMHLWGFVILFVPGGILSIGGSGVSAIRCIMVFIAFVWVGAIIGFGNESYISVGFVGCLRPSVFPFI